MTNFTITPTALPGDITVQRRPSRWIKVYEAMAENPDQWLAIEGLTSKRASSLQAIIRSHSTVGKPQRISTLVGFDTEAVTDRSHGKPIIVYVRATRSQGHLAAMAI